MFKEIQIRYELSDKCLLNCEFCTIRESKSRKYSNRNFSFSYDSIRSLKNVLTLCDMEYADTPVSIGYYEESLLHEEIILNILNVLKDKRYKHLILSSGIKAFSKKFITYLKQTPQKITLSFGYKEYLLKTNIKLLSDKELNPSLILVYSPKSLKDVYNFVHKYKQLKTLTDDIKISLDLQYNEEIPNMIEYVNYTEYLLGCSMTDLHLINRGGTTTPTIYIEPDGTVFSMIPFKNHIDNIHIINDVFCKRPSFCNSCQVLYKCASSTVNIYKMDDIALQKFCGFMHYVYKKVYRPICYTADINYQIIQKKYNDIKDYKTYKEWLDVFIEK